MEIAYLIAGKRFRAKDLVELNGQLAVHHLTLNLDNTNIEKLSVRRANESQNTIRYSAVPSAGYVPDAEDYDVVVGKMIGTNNGEWEVIEKDISDLETALNEVREDITDARIIVGSYWS